MQYWVFLLSLPCLVYQIPKSPCSQITFVQCKKFCYTMRKKWLPKVCIFGHTLNCDYFFGPSHLLFNLLYGFQIYTFSSIYLSQTFCEEGIQWKIILFLNVYVPSSCTRRKDFYVCRDYTWFIAHDCNVFFLFSFWVFLSIQNWSGVFNRYFVLSWSLVVIGGKLLGLFSPALTLLKFVLCLAFFSLIRYV